MTFLKGKKLIYFLPIGGLNDVLCQLSCCLIRALSESRVVIVDTSLSPISQVVFSDIVKPSERIRPYLYFTNSDKLLRSYCESNNLSFSEFSNIRTSMIKSDFDNINLAQYSLNPYSSAKVNNTVLFHSSLGGGLLSVRLLSLFTFTPNFIDIYTNRLSKLPQSYVAIHCRYTDLKVDISFLHDILHGLPSHSSVFFATDNYAIKRNIIEDFPELDIISLEYLSQDVMIDEVPLHCSSRNLNNSDYEALAFNLWLDLLAMVQSSKLYVVPLSQPGKFKYSGFSMLAFSLFNDQSILSCLHGRRSLATFLSPILNYYALKCNWFRHFLSLLRILNPYHYRSQLQA